MKTGTWQVDSADDLPPALAQQVREQLGDPTQVRAASPSKPMRPAKQSGPELIPIDAARTRAEVGGSEAWRRARPLAGVLWSVRTESTALRKIPGTLGGAAMWVYVVKGYSHFGFMLSGGFHYWEVQVKADDGRVLGVQLKKVRPA